MTISEDCINLTKRFEGCRLVAYPDPGTGGAPWTIGWGHTFGVKQGMSVNQEQADAWLVQDLENAAHIVNLWVTSPLEQHQFDALTDFVYNVGPGMPKVRDGFVWLRSGTHSTMLVALINGQHEKAAAEFPKWNKPPLPGLIARREAERELFLKAVASKQ